MAPDYEFRCLGCGVFIVSSHEAGFAPELKDDYCPRCKKDTQQQRWYSFGVGRGGSGEPVRSVPRAESSS